MGTHDAFPTFSVIKSWQQDRIGARRRLETTSSHRKWQRFSRRAVVTLTGAALLLVLSQEPIQANAIQVANGVVDIAADGQCSLIEAINNANDTVSGLVHADCAPGDRTGADTIFLYGGSFELTEPDNSTFGASGLPVITSAITLQGDGAILARPPGVEPFRILTVVNGHLSLDEVTIQGGRADQTTTVSADYRGGGGILGFNSTLVLNQSTVSGNSAPNDEAEYGNGRGGGIANRYGNLTITSSGIQGNTSGEAGGGIYHFGDLFYLDRSLVADNSSGSGGGTFLYDWSGNVTGDALVINHSKILNNTAEFAGGGVRAPDAHMKVTDSTIDGNIAGSDGGGFSLPYTRLIIKRSTVSNNIAVGKDGGGPLAPGGGGISIFGTLDAENCTFSGNSTGGNGGGIQGEEAWVWLRSSTLTANTSNQSGGGVFLTSAYSTPGEAQGQIAGTLISGNSASVGSEVYFDLNVTVTSNGDNLFGRELSAGLVGLTPVAGDTIPSIPVTEIVAATLSDNGGPTPTHSLPPASPAIDKRLNAGCSDPGLAIDQRGLPRNVDGDGLGSSTECDIGAFEVQEPPANDDDGVSDELEDNGPNNGDGNNDGTPDSEQGHVASLPNSGGGEYITLVVPAGLALTDVAAVENPNPAEAPPAVSFPAGFLSFGVEGLDVGGVLTLDLIQEGGTLVNAYYKYGPTHDNPTDHWYEFLYDGTTGAEMLPDRIALHFVDGERGDSDLTADGVITDPGAPAVDPTLCHVLTLSKSGQGHLPVAEPLYSVGCDEGTYVQGETIDLSGALPDDGWHVSNWAGTSFDEAVFASNIVVMPAGDHVAQVNYEATNIGPMVFQASVHSDGSGSLDRAESPSISADGRFIAFHSWASNLVDDDDNNHPDVFVHDRMTGMTTMVSVNPQGHAGVDDSWVPALSADGRYVAFQSNASDLDAERFCGHDIFLRDMLTQVTTCISRGLYDQRSDSASYLPDISDDGNVVVFESEATNLVENDINGIRDVFAYNRITGELKLVTVDNDGNQANYYLPYAGVLNAVSGNGRYVAFVSAASNLVLGDTNECQLGSHDLGPCPDVFVHDLSTGKTERVSIHQNGTQGNGASVGRPAISYDGSLVAFTSFADNLVDGLTQEEGTSRIFLHDTTSGETTHASLVPEELSGRDANNPSISAGGERIVFDHSHKVWLYDRVLNRTSVVSITSEGGEPNELSYEAASSADGNFIAFTSFADNIASSDNNDGLDDVFVRDMTQSVPLDGDGVDDETEDNAPNNGDGNNDGTPDNQQDNVASLPNNYDGEYVTLVTPSGTALTGVSATDSPAPGTEPDDAAFPVGFLWFGIDGVETGGATTLEVLLEVGSNFNTYYKYGPTPDSPTDHWYEFLYDGTTGAEILPDKIVLHFIDGLRGDSDLTADGDIEDPGAPAIIVPAAIYLSPTGTGKLGVGAAAKAFTGADILSYIKSSNTWDILYDGSAARTTKNVGAFAFDGDDILLGFSAAQAITGLGTAAPQDLVRFTPTSTGYNNTTGTFAWFFDGSDVGLTTNGEIIDALWIDADGQLYISTTGAGEVPLNSANPTGPKRKFQDEDVLRFTPAAGSNGQSTAGTWELYWDPTAMTGMAAEDINGYWEDPATGDRYVTILGAFAVGNAAYGGRFTGNGKTILRFTPNAAAPQGWAPAEKVVWLAPGATFPSNIDGIEMAR